MIEASQIERSYGTFKAVNGISFEIEQGQVVGLLGHNGAGKTTIIKMLTGFLEPSAGTINVDGLDVVQQRRAVQARTGYLPENCPLYPEMTVIDFLDFHASLHGVPTGERLKAIRDAIDRTALGAKATSEISTLSRGYRQRVGVAQAILHRPAVLILDEPTNGLDPSQIQHMRTLIRDLAEEATVIISTHILQEVEAVCDRVLILRSGRLALDSSLATLGTSNRIRLTLDRPPEQVGPMLQRLGTVSRVEPVSDSGNHQTYLVDTDDAIATAPLIARAVADAGWDLFGLEPEQHDLEALFGAVNEAKEMTHA